MLKLTKTGIGLLTKQYRSVLRKCLLLNLGLFFVAGCLNLTVIKIMKAESLYLDDMIKISNSSGEVADKVILDGKNGYGKLYLYGKSGTNAKYADSFLSFYIYDELKTSLNTSSFKLNDSGFATGIDFAANVKAGTTDASHLATTGAVNQLLNYYYTFRVDERTEVIEFAKELRSNKKEMSSLDFMPIKSSSDLRINLIKAEDPLTFSVKTRDDSLVLMEVCHA